MKHLAKKILIIRFSSFGDIVQCLHSAILLKKYYLAHHKIKLNISFLTKEQFCPIVLACPYIDEVIVLKKQNNILDIFRLAVLVRSKKFDLIYDAHFNIRTRIIKIINFDNNIIVRFKYRLKRIFLFYFKINFYNFPFIGSHSFIDPLISYFSLNCHEIISPKLEDYRGLDNFVFNINTNTNTNTNTSINSNTENKETIVICPSAAWKLKRWPIDYWKELIIYLDKNYENKIIILGGPQDIFCKEFEELSPKVINLAGKVSLLYSAQVIKEASLIISGDTGLIHLADLLNKKGIELIGPSAFGHIENKNISILEQKKLTCKPCSKDGHNKCRNKIHQKCMKDIKIADVIDAIVKSGIF